jgi:multidrug resistance efflux pump
MRQMDAEELQQHLELLRNQVAAHQRRLQNLHAAVRKGEAGKAQQKRIKRLEDELERLNALVMEGVRLVGKAGR